MRDKNFEEFWKVFLIRMRQPKWCEVNRLQMIAEHYWQENMKYYDKTDCSRCDTLLEFVTTDKRPYGNKDIPASISFNLGWGYEENDYMSEDAKNEALSLHKLLIANLEKEKAEINISKENENDVENKYVIKIYDVSNDDLPLDDWCEDRLEGFAAKETVYAKTGEDLLKVWNTLFETYEGWAYFVGDITSKQCILAGTFDPNDEDAIIEYIK